MGLVKIDIFRKKEYNTCKYFGVSGESERVGYMPVRVGLRYIDIWKDSMEDAVVAYEQEPLHKGQIVFYGPSYFTRWSTKFGMKPLRECLLGASGEKCAVNRGFGSSSAEHQLYYYARMVRPLEPKVLVYTCHANGPSFGYSDEESWELGQRVIAWAKTDFPGIHIYLVGHHPSRDEDAEKTAQKRALNATVRAFAENTEDCFFLDPYERPELAQKDIFVEDGVHYNQAGYDLYAQFYREALAEELAKF